ncbi:hypothetical protein LCGC14_0174540 [marine sediment metagenome]|uniref:Uncharacterized protein n=1 Tax=marine sediment metagenome TaxID=412755 RepID=A0A0F9UR13_9ZZZZ
MILLTNIFLNSRSIIFIETQIKSMIKHKDVRKEQKERYSKYSQKELEQRINEINTTVQSFRDEKRVLHKYKDQLEWKKITDYYSLDVRVIVPVNKSNILENGEVNWDEVFRDTSMAIIEGFEQNHGDGRGVDGIVSFKKHKKLKMNGIDYGDLSYNKSNLVEHYLTEKLPKFSK